MAEKKIRKRRFGDRYDGFKVKSKDPLFDVIPHIMRSRLDSQVFIEEEIEVSHLRTFLLEHKKEIPGLSMYHFLTAVMLRTMVDRPRLNRFVSGRKIYSRSYLRASLAFKNGLDEDGEEMLVSPKFDENDTLADVVRRFNEAIEEATPKDDEVGNSTEKTAKIVSALPGFIKKFFVWLMRSLDSVGLMPKIINEVSPFHSSVFITNVGSIGLSPIYHHLYEFGTTSAFLAIGKKETKYELDREGNVVSKHVIKLRFVLDERICDGFYYASAMKRIKYYVKHPELLLIPPETISEDY